MIEPGALYLVTGGAGFIGSHLVERLLGEGASVRVLDDFSTGLRANLEPFADRIDVIEGSVVHEADCQKAMMGVDYVFHEAALPSVARSVADPLATHDVNDTGTLRLLHQARGAGVRRFVYAGSSSAYGDTPVLPKREEMAPHPLSPYAVAKLAGEHYVRCFHHVYGLETVVLRYFNVFGPRQDPSSQYSAVIAIFMDRALEGLPPTINGSGEQTRDFTFIENVVEANLLACHAPPDGVAGEVFNVGCGTRTTVNDLWKAVREVVGTEVQARYGPARPGDVQDSLASLELIQERLGYRATVSLEEGLRRTLEWFRAGRG